MHKRRAYTNRQVVGVNEGLIALALLKGQKEMSLGMGRENHRNLLNDYFAIVLMLSMFIHFAYLLNGATLNFFGGGWEMMGIPTKYEHELFSGLNSAGKSNRYRYILVSLIYFS